MSRRIKRVVISLEAWRVIDRLLSDLPFRVVSPVVKLMEDTGGVQVIEADEADIADLRVSTPKVVDEQSVQR